MNVTQFSVANHQWRCTGAYFARPFFHWRILAPLRLSISDIDDASSGAVSVLVFTTLIGIRVALIESLVAPYPNERGQRVAVDDPRIGKVTPSLDGLSARGLTYTCSFTLRFSPVRSNLKFYSPPRGILTGCTST